MQVDMLCTYNVETPMRDGTVLRADLYRPAVGGPFPALLLRSIFRKRDMGRAFGQYDPSYFVKHGYAVMIQDARGLGESDGEFDRFTADGPDGYDTIEWMAQQPWCDGSIGMMGSYFAGYLQLMAAAERPPHLKAMAPMQTSVSINRDCDNRGFMFSSHIGWCMSRQISRLRDGRYDEETTRKYLPMLLGYLRSYTREQLTALPLCDMPVLQNTPFRIFKDYFTHLVDGYDDMALLKKEGRNMDVAALDVPAFYISGWYDSSRTPLVDHCLRQRQAGVDSRVLVAPWKIGEAPARPDSALENGENIVDIQAELVEWFDHHLKGRPAPQSAPIRYWDMVTGEAYAGETWPLSGAQQQVWHVTESSLSAKAPDEQGCLHYLHDPANPLPYRPFGPGKGWETDDRQAVCLSAPLKEDLPLGGLVKAQLSISADAPDADVMLTLLDVAPDGTTFAICDGATRARYRQDWVSRPLTEGEVYPVEVLLGHTVYTLRQGHRLGLAMYGSAFPKYDVNHGTGERPAHDAQLRRAVVNVHFGGAMPCALVLPLRR